MTMNGLAIMLTNFVDYADIGMAQGGGGLCFTLEAFQ
jgi:hypothetical protein